MFLLILSCVVIVTKCQLPSSSKQLRMNMKMLRRLQYFSQSSMKTNSEAIVALLYEECIDFFLNIDLNP